MEDLDNFQAQLTAAIAPVLTDSGKAWFDKTLEKLTASDQPLDDLGLYSAMAKRKLGNRRLEHAPAIDAVFSPLDIRRWGEADAARLVLLLSVVKRLPDQTEELVQAYYRMGDESERIALIRGLVLFAPADYLTTIALDAGRTNSLELLSALSLDNPYPASFYSEQTFNQMVLKCLFLGLAIERVVGLEQRANPDLTRMCENYVVERENASRTVPVDIWLAIGPHATTKGEQQILAYLNHEETGHRYYTALALGQRLSENPSLKSHLQDRQKQEDNTLVLDLLQDLLQQQPG